MNTTKITNFILNYFYSHNYQPKIEVFPDSDEPENPNVQINIDFDGRNSDSLAIFYGVEADKVLFVPIYEIQEHFTNEDLKAFNESNKDNLGPFEEMIRPEEGLDEIHVYGQIKVTDVSEEWLDSLVKYFEEPNELVMKLRELSRPSNFLLTNLQFTDEEKLLFETYGFERVRDLMRLTHNEFTSIFKDEHTHKVIESFMKLNNLEFKEDETEEEK